jgi:hypothetical protein
MRGQLEPCLQPGRRLPRNRALERHAHERHGAAGLICRIQGGALRHTADGAQQAADDIQINRPRTNVEQVTQQ